jgi:hypothetical protein
MEGAEHSAQRQEWRPYRDLREDPRYDELKRIIENFPRDKMHRLKSYIQRWANDS